MTHSSSLRRRIAGAIGLVLAWALVLLQAQYELSSDLLAVCIGAVVIIIAVMALLRSRSSQTLTDIFLLAGAAWALVFVLSFPYNCSQHDLESFVTDLSGSDRPYGHLGYIAYIAKFARLPLLNPTIDDYSIFYHPPLFHMLSALMYRLHGALGFSEKACLESMQLVPYFSIVGVMVLGTDIARRVGCRKSLPLAALGLAFQPGLWLMGSALTNDALSLFFIVAVLWQAMRWMETHAMRDMAFTGLWLGLGMASKLNVALLIPPLAVVFIESLIRRRIDRKALWKQAAVFLLLSVPIAVAWYVYHLAAFDMPFTYVRPAPEIQSVRECTLYQRFGLPTWQMIRQPFFSIHTDTDCNLWMQTLKTAVFDELPMYSRGTMEWNLSFAAMAALAVVCLIGIVGFCRLPKKPQWMFLAAYAVLLTVQYISFYVQYPYVCTANFRYVAPLLLPISAGLCAWSDKLKSKALKALLWLLCIGYAAAASGVYAILFRMS